MAGTVDGSDDGEGQEAGEFLHNGSAVQESYSNFFLSCFPCARVRGTRVVVDITFFSPQRIQGYQRGMRIFQTPKRKSKKRKRRRRRNTNSHILPDRNNRRPRRLISRPLNKHNQQPDSKPQALNPPNRPLSHSIPHPLFSPPASLQTHQIQHALPPSHLPTA